jgi:hypothetical protein
LVIKYLLEENMTDLDQYQSAMNIKIAGADSTAVVTGTVVGTEDGLVVRNIPTSGLVQQTAEIPDSNRVFSPDTDNSQDYESFSISKNANGTLYGFSGFNSSASEKFVQIHNSSTVPTSGAIPTLILYTTPRNNFFWDGGKFGMFFSSGISWVSSTTGPTYTPDSVTSGSLWVNVFYK